MEGFRGDAQGQRADRLVVVGVTTSCYSLCPVMGVQSHDLRHPSLMLRQSVVRGVRVGDLALGRLQVV